SDFNTPHWLAINTIYTLPSLRPKGIVGRLTGGWRFSNIIHVSSGLPFSVVENNCRSNSMVLGNCSDRVNVLPGCDRIIFNGDPNQPYFNPSCFAIQAPGTLGNESRNSLMGPLHTNWDLSFVKDTVLSRLGEDKHLEFRAEFFNLLNHPDFSIPSVRGAFTA